MEEKPNTLQKTTLTLKNAKFIVGIQQKIKISRPKKQQENATKCEEFLIDRESEITKLK